MDSRLSSIRDLLKKYNQEHLLSFYNELSDEQRNCLLTQIESIDFEKINKLYSDLKTISIPTDEIIEPLDYFIKSSISIKERRNLENKGSELLKLGNYAVVTMAGGQGTRLGHKGPKGTFELNLHPKKESLFEILTFFVQSKLPLVNSDDGKILLIEPYKVHEASNGNGNLFESLACNRSY